MSFLDVIFGSNESHQNGSKVSWKPLHNLEQLNAIVEESGNNPIAIFKHSTRCSVSRMALRQFENEFDLSDKITTYFLDLLEYREVSNEITTRFNVEHQSPQLLLIRNGKSIYDASHNDIDVEDLKRYL